MTVMGYELHSLRLEIRRLLREHRDGLHQQAAQGVGPADRARAATGYVDFLHTLTRPTAAPHRGGRDAHPARKGGR